MSKKNGLADPSRLKPFDANDKQLFRVVIETPKGSRNKFAFDPEEHIFELKKVLPAGMTFPYDFGFVPNHLGGSAASLNAEAAEVSAKSVSGKPPVGQQSVQKPRIFRASS